MTKLLKDELVIEGLSVTADGAKEKKMESPKKVPADRIETTRDSWDDVIAYPYLWCERSEVGEPN